MRAIIIQCYYGPLHTYDRQAKCHFLQYMHKTVIITHFVLTDALALKTGWMYYNICPPYHVDSWQINQQKQGQPFL